jgi:4-hydroxy-tetrahydrodipicolinate reductase
MKVILQGYKGKTGKLIYDTLIQRGIEVLPVDINNSLDDYYLEKNIDAIIDFSSIDGTKSALEFALNNNISLIIGTTNIEEINLKKYHEIALAKNIAIIALENYLLTMPSIMKFLASLDKHFEIINIEESHHESKVDAPSGTAKMLKRCFDDRKLVPILSKRVKMYVYEHIVTLKNDYEEISLTHRCINKEGYAIGVINVLYNIDKYKGVILNVKELIT